jgi:hypothetical protein
VIVQTVVEIPPAYTIVAPLSNAVAEFAGVNITVFGAVPHAELNVIVTTVPDALGVTPAVTLIVPLVSVPVMLTVGEVPAPAPAAIVGAVPPDAM